MTLQSKLTEIAELDKKIGSLSTSIISVTYKVTCTMKEFKENTGDTGVIYFPGYTVVLEVKG